MTNQTTARLTVFGREPALWLGMIAAAIQLLSSLWLPLTTGQQGVLNALAVAVFGAIAAFAVSRDQGVPALLGVLKAVIAVGLAFGLHWSPELQGEVMAFATALSAMWTRTQVSP